MAAHSINPWLIIKEPGLLKSSFMSPAEILTMERLWKDEGKTIVKVSHARLILVGSLKWIEQFIDIGKFDEFN